MGSPSRDMEVGPEVGSPMLTSLEATLGNAATLLEASAVPKSVGTSGILNTRYYDRGMGSECCGWSMLLWARTHAIQVVYRTASLLRHRTVSIPRMCIPPHATSPAFSLSE